ncbi:MAG TPA: chloride channel protein [Actinomycetota bacterium]|nr:chloride channel protein [Actinomycetota bacterium]
MSSPSVDPAALLRSRRYVGLLVLAAVLGVPVSAAAYGFLALVSGLQEWLFSDLPRALGFNSPPLWWPLPLLTVAGVLVGLTIRYLPGRGGHSPADGFKAGGVPSPMELPGIAIAALATLSLGAVLGPEAPLIALGAGLAALAVRLARREVPDQATAVVAAAGSFAAVSTLLGSPLLGAFLLMEASGLGGPMLGLVLVPGLVAAGVGSLIFIGLDSWTGLGTFSLSLPDVPPFAHPDLAQFGWALVIGVAAAVVGSAIRRLALLVRPQVERRLLLLCPLAGVVVAALAIIYAQASGHGVSEVLFSGQDALGPLISQSASYSAGALVLLVVCKGLAYSVSLASFRGGPVFPAMFLGAAGGIALSHLPGLPMVAGAAMGIGAMSVTLLRLPLTSVLLATLLLAEDGLAVMPLVIVAVAVAYVVSARLTPDPPPQDGVPADRSGDSLASKAESRQPLGRQTLTTLPTAVTRNSWPRRASSTARLCPGLPAGTRSP